MPSFGCPMIPERDAILAGTETLIRTGRYEAAITEFERFVHQHPGAWPMAAMLADLFRRAGETASAEGRSAEAVAYFELVANWRAARGDRLGAEELRARIDVIELDDVEAQINDVPIDAVTTPAAESHQPAALPAPEPAVALAREAVARGDAIAAANHLTAEMAGDDPRLILTVAELLIRGGQLDRGIALADRAMSVDRKLAEAVARLGSEVAAHEPNAGFLLVEMAEVMRAQEVGGRTAKSA